VIGDANIPLIQGSVNEGDGIGAWKALEAEYLHRNSSLRHRLKSDLKLVKFSDYLDKPSSYFIRVNEIVNHLKQIQVAIEDDDLVLTLRDQLPPSEYQTVIYDINKQGSSMTFEETKRLVIATHDVLSAHKGSSGSKYDANEVEQAMIAWRGRNNNSPSIYQQEGGRKQAAAANNRAPCTRCGHRGHGRYDCNAGDVYCTHHRSHTHATSACMVVAAANKKKSAVSSAAANNDKTGDTAMVAMTQPANTPQHEDEIALCSVLDNDDGRHGDQKTSSEGGECWIVDSGSSSHMTGFASDLTDFHPFLDGPRKILVGGKKTLYAVGSGKVHVNLPVAPARDSTALSVRSCSFEALYVQDLGYRLYSTSKAIELGHEITLGHPHASIKLAGSQGYIPLSRVSSLHTLPVASPLRLSPPQATGPARHRPRIALAAATSRQVNAHLFHSRCCHFSFARLPAAQESGAGHCASCRINKAIQAPARFINEPWANQALDLVHMDLQGPIKPASANSQFRYILAFVDEITKFTDVRYLKNKSAEEVRRAIESFIAEVGTPKTLRSDNGLEFRNQDVAKLCANHRILQQFTAPYSPFQNGTVE